jgi:hypothetical protein
MDLIAERKIGNCNIRYDGKTNITYISCSSVTVSLEEDGNYFAVCGNDGDYNKVT